MTKETGHSNQTALHEALEKLEKVSWKDTFQFKCHKGLSCWTVCCSNADLFLTPYDILRLKEKLRMKSGDFLEKHTTNVIDPDFGLPSVKLQMGKEGKCPFVTDDGCSIYEDRPTTCRLYPLGQATSSGTEKHRGEKIYFKIKEDHCLGWKEPESQTLKEWVVDQGADQYNFFNELLIGLTLSPKLGELAKLDDKKLGMIYMALYDLDTFREFVFNSSLLSRLNVEEETLEKIKTSDEELLRFGLRWIEFSIMGVPTFEINKE